MHKFKYILIISLILKTCQTDIGIFLLIKVFFNFTLYL